MLYLPDISLCSVRRPAGMIAALLFWAGAGALPANAQPGAAAKLLQMTGQVSVLRGNAQWALNVGDLIQPQQIVVTGPDGSATFQVADGSTFEVFPNSKAVFRETMGDWRDLLRMVIGRVRVQIQHLGGQPNPNKVRTPTAVISVRGTIFDVTVEDDQGTTLVLVDEGRVEVRHILQPGSKVLNEGEWVEVFWNQPLAARKTDHGAILQHAVNMVKDTLYEALMRSRVGGGSGGSGTGTTPGGTSGDKNGNGTSNGGSTSGGNGAPPPPPPPPPPPAPAQ